MTYRLAADFIFIVHPAFVLFVLFGGVLVLRWRWVAWLHLPALLWGIYREFAGVICPLTPVEIHLRQFAGQAGYEGDFVTHYLVPILYPTGLTREVQTSLGLAALLPSVLIYGALWLRRPLKPEL